MPRASLLLKMEIIHQETKIMLGVKNFISEKSGLVADFTTIWNCASEFNGIIAPGTDGKTLQKGN